MSDSSNEITKDNVRVVINSRNRNSSSTTTSSSFTYTLNGTVNRVHKISVLSVQIPFSYYVINSTNNTIRVTVGASTESATVPNGNYNSATICTALVSAMSTLSGNPYTVTYSQSTMKLTISSASTFKILSTGTNNICKNLGFVADSATAMSNTGDSAINLSGWDYFVIKSTVLTQYQVVPNKTANALSNNTILYTVPINGGPTDIIIDTPSVSIPIRLGYKQSFQSNIDFQLEDDQGNSVSLNGRDWSIELLFETS
jgi:hypothetical protein